MVFIRFPFNSDLKVLDYGKRYVCADRIKESIESHLDYNQFALLYNGKPLQDMDVIPADSTVQVIFSLCGGKGGFGSMLRAIGAQIEKTTNREACRDLSGRRLRDINEEQRLKKWIAKEAEREAEKVKRRQARIERLKSKAPHNFFDFEYEREISELPDRIDDALSEGLQKAKQPNKRPLEKEEVTKKSWLSEEFTVSSSDSELDEANNESDESPPKKLKVTHKDSSGCSSDASGSSQPQPGSSKDYSFSMEESSLSSDAKAADTKWTQEENSTSSDKMDLEVGQTPGNGLEKDKPDRDSDAAIHISVEEGSQVEENKISNSMEVDENTLKDSKVASKSESLVKEPETKDDLPIDLLNFQNLSEVEALGLDRLKSELMIRGLKCGGSLSDRAQRLWKIRSLQPHEYPANLLVKTKK